MPGTVCSQHSHTLIGPLNYQLYRKAEQEAKKCHVLEMKIDEMKKAKVALIRRQKEEAAKHKQCTNEKTQEIKALKRREKNADRKMQKLEAECQSYRAILERSQAKVCI